MAQCRHCGSPIVKTAKKGRPRVYCSYECKEASHAEKGKRERDARLVGRRCVICDAVIESRHGRARCCSSACSMTYSNRRRQEERRQVWEASNPMCARCGVSIADRRRGSVFCSFECKQLTHANTWMKNSPHYMRRYLYGITQEQYEAMLAAQGGRCAICGVSEPGGKGGWHVDHCHDTKAIRGLLCHHCNIMLGNAKDDPETLRAAVRYLERSTREMFQFTMTAA